MTRRLADGQESSYVTLAILRDFSTFASAINKETVVDVRLMMKPVECASGRCLFLWMVVMDEIVWDTFSYYRFPLGTIKPRGNP